MQRTSPISRQEGLEQILSEASRSPELQQALQAFQIGQHEYARAIAGLSSIQIINTNSSNPEGRDNGIMVGDEDRDR